MLKLAIMNGDGRYVFSVGLLPRHLAAPTASDGRRWCLVKSLRRKAVCNAFLLVSRYPFAIIEPSAFVSYAFSEWSRGGSISSK